MAFRFVHHNLTESSLSLFAFEAFIWRPSGSQWQERGRPGTTWAERLADQRCPAATPVGVASASDLQGLGWRRSSLVEGLSSCTYLPLSGKGPEPADKERHFAMVNKETWVPAACFYAVSMAYTIGWTVCRWGVRLHAEHFSKVAIDSMQ